MAHKIDIAKNPNFLEHIPLEFFFEKIAKFDL